MEKKSNESSPTPKTKRSFGISFLAVCFILFGFLGSLNYISYFVQKTQEGGITFETYKKQLNTNPSFQILLGHYRASNPWDNPQVKKFEAFFDELMQNSSLSLAMDSGLLLQIAYVILGVGLWKLKAWSRTYTIYLHLFLIPFHALLGYFLIEGVWDLANNHFPEAGLHAYVGSKNLFLLIQTTLIVAMYLLFVGYLYLPKIKRQFA